MSNLLAKGLTKIYRKRKVVNRIDLSISPGEVVGLLGPNGAGKTTLISILTGVIGKDSGEVTVGGLDLDRELGRIQSRCSYVPQTLAFYPRLSARENLEYFGSLWGLRGRKLKERIAFSIDVGSMQAFVDKRVAAFSGGMKRRLNLAIGLLNEPDILYLDEPTVGVDTQSRNYILETIKRLNRERKTTIVYTSQCSGDSFLLRSRLTFLMRDKYLLKVVHRKLPTVRPQILFWSENFNL